MGAWIEITLQEQSRRVKLSRTPRWVRGLKSLPHFNIKPDGWSHPTMGAWIEIEFISELADNVSVAPHDGCVD